MEMSVYGSFAYWNRGLVSFRDAGSGMLSLNMANFIAWD